ncbi:hypothetical protein HYV80_04300 [Candidatus Woesearchaeota archaeon]|nr:hypothetical protein [Candidatus Woesearchaeota archaeon]
MKLHQQFDLNLRALKPENFNNIPRAINMMPGLVEGLVKRLLGQGYVVIESSARYMGIPKSITVIKDFSGPFATMFSAKINEEFSSFSKRIGVERLFE